MNQTVWLGLLRAYANVINSHKCQASRGLFARPGLLIKARKETPKARLLVSGSK